MTFFLLKEWDWQRPGLFDSRLSLGDSRGKTVVVSRGVLTFIIRVMVKYMDSKYKERLPQDRDEWFFRSFFALKTKLLRSKRTSCYSYFCLCLGKDSSFSIFPHRILHSLNERLELC